MKYVRAAVGMAIVAASSPYVCQAQSPQRYNIQPDSVSVSGISSGADFAHQLHVAYSSKIHGVGLLAASPYHCAKDDLSKALQYCSKIGAEFGQPYNGPPSPDYVESLVSDTKKAFNEDQIDDPAGIKTAKIYLFSGTNDTKVPQPIVKAVELFNGHQASLPDKILNRAKQPSYSKRRYNIERANVRTGKLCAAASSAKLPKEALNFCGERGRLLHGSEMSVLFHLRPSLNIRVGLLGK